MPNWERWTDNIIHIAVIIVLAIVMRWLVALLIRHMVRLSTERAAQHLERLGRPGRLLRQATSSDSDRQQARARTMGSMLGSAATFVIVSVALLTILADVGINLAPVLASAGVGGVALAFGAQSLVKDVISGIFLIVEDQFGVGDTITVNEVTGTVETVGLRVTSLRDGDGKLWYLRNGEITKVANVSQGWSMATVDVLVHPDADAPAASTVLRGVCAAVFADAEFADALVEEPTVLGVEKITPDAMTLRISAKCLANQQWGVQRALLARSKRALDEAGIPGPVNPWH